MDNHEINDDIQSIVLKDGITINQPKLAIRGGEIVLIGGSIFDSIHCKFLGHIDDCGEPGTAGIEE